MGIRKYESEIRIVFDDINPFLKILNSYNAKIITKYSFKDHCYKPKGIINWNLEEKIMRIREWEAKSQILFTKIRIIKIKNLSFKQSIFPSGKLILYEGSQQEAQEILQDWNFEFWFIIEKKEGCLYNIKKPFDLTIAVENIKDLGYTAEIELWGENINEIYDEFHEIIKLLNLDPNKITYKPLPKIFFEKLIE